MQWEYFTLFQIPSIRLLFVYWSDYSLKQEIDIKPTMLSIAARAAQAACAMVAQNISHLLWYKIATTKTTKAKCIVKPNLACKASVSARVPRLESWDESKKKKECSRSKFRGISQLETLDTQAKPNRIEWNTFLGAY